MRKLLDGTYRIRTIKFYSEGQTAYFRMDNQLYPCKIIKHIHREFRHEIYKNFHPYFNVYEVEPIGEKP